MPSRTTSEDAVGQKRRAALAALVTVCISGCSLSDGSRTLTIVPNPLAAVASQVNRHRIRGPDETWTLFTDDRRDKERTLGTGFYRLCKELSFNESRLIPISGLRILKMNALTSLPARGYPSAIDFYGSFSSRRAKADTIVEAIEKAVALERLPVILEFQEAGEWKRSRFDLDAGRTVKVSALDLIASHGVIFRQIPTGHEREYAIFAVEIAVVELATDKIVARNVGLVRDTYLGAHNRFALIADSRRCGYPVEENFVGSWLLSLIRPHPAGSINPYHGSSKRAQVRDENRHWADPKREP